MRILYLASDIDIDQAHGGATHVREVAGNLVGLGHEVAVVARCRPVSGNPSFHSAPRWLPRYARFAAAHAAARVLRSFHADVVIERYYNFGGEGAWITRGTSIPYVLEVNAPMIEYPASTKQRLDRLLIFKPLERYRRWMAQRASLIVTPLPSILPAGTDPRKILRLPWGANTALFVKRGRREQMRARLGIPPQVPVAAFAGSFRRWHGADDLVRAAESAIHSGAPDLHVLLIGDGEVLPWLLDYATRHLPKGRVVATGRVAYEDVPELLEAADFSVAPFSTRRHPYLQLGFYWSPLKVFEAMAMDLPVITIDVPELREILGSGGLFYREGRTDELAAAIARLASDAQLRAEMGSVCGERVEKYSWRAHCEAIEERLPGLIVRGATGASPA